MARRRMIEVSIAYDRQFNSLPDFAQLLFLKVLPHTDDYGRFEGDPEVLRARVDPFFKKNIAQYAAAMAQIAEAGLWTWYKTPEGRSVVQYKPTTFERINAFLIKQRGNAEFPEYMESYELICGDMVPYPIRSNKQGVESKKQKEDKPESFDAVKTLWEERKYPAEECEKFYNYYTANGWRVGKNPMKDWRAAAAGWVSRAKEYSVQKGESADPLGWMKYTRKNK